MYNIKVIFTSFFLFSIFANVTLLRRYVVTPCTVMGTYS